MVLAWVGCTSHTEAGGVSWDGGRVGVPLALPLDSGFRRNDEWRGRNDEGTLRMSSERLIEVSILAPMSVAANGGGAGAALL